MSGRGIPTIWGKRWGFPGIELLPAFQPFMVSFVMVMALVCMSFSLLMCYNELILKFKVQQKLSCLPSWTYLVLISLHHIPGLCSSSKGCTHDLDSKVSVQNAGDLSSSPGLGRSPGEGNSNPLQYYCLENPMDRGAWSATVYGVTKSQTELRDFIISLHSGSFPPISVSLVQVGFFFNELHKNFSLFLIDSQQFSCIYSFFLVFPCIWICSSVWFLQSILALYIKVVEFCILIL